MIQTIRKTEGDRFLKVLSLKASHLTPVYSGGVDNVTMRHGLGFIPSIRMFFYFDDHPERLFSTPSAYLGGAPSATWNTYQKFNIIWTVDTSSITISLSNFGSSSNTINIIALINSEKATATQ